MRNSVEIKVWMLRQKPRVTPKRIADELGFDQSFVVHWIAGRRGSTRIEQWFREHGLPKKYIGKDPNRKGEFASYQARKQQKTRG